MKTVIKVFFCAAFLASLILPAVVSAEEFSADVSNQTKLGNMSGKIYVSDGNVRMEMPGAITITRMDDMMAFILIPEQKAYMEQKIDPYIFASTTSSIPGETERTFVADESLGGRNTKKYRVSYTSLAGSATMVQWKDPSISMPIRTADIDGKWSIEFSNIVTGPQNDSLFDIPDSYNKFIMPDMAEMMEAAQQTVVENK
jgi:hypothetical protein